MARSNEMFEFKCKLIEEIKMYPAIYDKAHPDHFRRNKKDAIFRPLVQFLESVVRFISFFYQTHGNNRKVFNKLFNSCKNMYKYL